MKNTAYSIGTNKAKNTPGYYLREGLRMIASVLLPQQLPVVPEWIPLPHMRQTDYKHRQVQ